MHGELLIMLFLAKNMALFQQILTKLSILRKSDEISIDITLLGSEKYKSIYITIQQK